MVGSFARRYNTGMINWFENIIKDIPLLNLVYSSIKDLMTSFMGEKKKFNKKESLSRVLYIITQISIFVGVFIFFFLWSTKHFIS